MLADTTDEIALGRYLTDELARLEVEVAPASRCRHRVGRQRAGARRA